MLATTRTHVLVRATDPILQNGVCVALRTRPEVWLVDEQADVASTVAVVAADRFCDRAAQLLRTVQGRGFTRSY
ncbi:MAG: hypothetical protein LC635_03140 [Pseudonocardiaceae bacterium]|nr:hypothetical protein [Pseudonocardiaceae bacterium]